MTISSTATKVSYNGDASTVAFAYTFKIYATSELDVIVRDADGAETTKTLTTHYSVSGAGEDSGGTVTFVTAPAATEVVVIRRALALTQATDYVENDPFPAASHEDALDRLTIISQQQQEEIDRSLKAADTDPTSVSLKLPAAALRASKLVSFDSSGDVAVVSTDTLDVTTLVAFADWLVFTATGDGSTVSYTLAAEPGQRGNTQVYLDGVYQAKSTYTLAGTNLTFTTAPGSGVAIEVVHGQATLTTSPATGSIDTTHLAADAVTGAKIADNTIDSEHYAAGSIDLEHMSSESVDEDNLHVSNSPVDGYMLTAQSANAGGLTWAAASAALGNDSVDSQHYVDGSIDTAHIGDNQVTLSKMAGGTDGQIITYDASGDPVAVGPGSDGQVLTSTGAGSPPAFEDAGGGGGFTEGTEVTPTSGQSAAFTSIPSGTKVIFVTWSGVSFNDYSYLKIQLGDSGGLESSGYVGTTISIYGGTITQGVPASGRATSTTYFVMGGSNGDYGMAGSVSLHGVATLTLEDSTNNTWGFTSMMTGAGVDMDWGAGSKSLSGELTQIAVQSGAVGTEASSQFDAGNINILYSG